jgi:hypothetical protein
MDVVLDLSLDFFVWPPGEPSQSDAARPADEDVEYVAPEADVRAFLERQCHLRRGSPLIGAVVDDPSAAFGVWRDWLRDGILRAPFDVVHVSARSGLDNGGNGYLYLMNELLVLPVGQRARPFVHDLNGMNDLNYLAFAIANQWLAAATYVYPREPTALFEANARRLLQLTGEVACEYVPIDIARFYCRDMESSPGLIELKHYRDFSSIDALEINSGTWTPREPVHREPPVPLRKVAGPRFERNDFTHLVVAHCRTYTPLGVDVLVATCRDYLRTLPY